MAVEAGLAEAAASVEAVALEEVLQEAAAAAAVGKPPNKKAAVVFTIGAEE